AGRWVRWHCPALLLDWGVGIVVGSESRMNSSQHDSRSDKTSFSHMHTVAVIEIATPIPFSFFQAEDGIRDRTVTGVHTCALPISLVLFGDGKQFINPPPSFRRHLRRDTLEDVAFRTRTEGRDYPGEDRGARQDVVPAPHNLLRSEERRVGKEGRSRWQRCYEIESK